MSTIGRLNFHNGLTQQNLNAEYLVLYNSSAKDANALVVNRSSLDLEFICESKSYVYYLNNENEAYYLTALLNSSVPNFLMKDFQTKGLFGPRDIHKKILNIYFPKFDENNKLHLSLAALSKSCHDKTEKYVETNPPNSELTPIKLGKYRVDIKRHLSKEMADIDKIVRKIIKE
jgi:hypothetical protein